MDGLLKNKITKKKGKYGNAEIGTLENDGGKRVWRCIGWRFNEVLLYLLMECSVSTNQRVRDIFACCRC